MLIIKQAWFSTGTSGGLSAVELLGENVLQGVFYANHSTIATTQSVSLQSAQQSSGPWFIEASTQMATGNISTNFAMRLTGPVGPFIRPYLHTTSTGEYNFLFVGVAS